MYDRLRVTLVLPYGIVGGAELWLLSLLDATDRLDVDAIVLGEGPLRAELESRGIPVEVWPVGRRPRALAGPSLRLALRLRRTKPDVVLAAGVKGAIVVTGAGWLGGARTVWARHDHSFEGPRVKALARSFDAVVATSPELAEGCGRDDTVVIPPPLPMPSLHRAVARRVLAVSHGVVLDDVPTAAVIGRLSAYKGIDDAIRALARPGGLAWRLVVVGGEDPGCPGEAARLSALATKLGVVDRVRLTGPIPGAGRLIAAFDALAVLTRPAGGRNAGGGHARRGRGPDREGFGITALEAMAAGVPVIATEPGAIGPRLADRAGLTVPAGDPRAVAHALGALTDRALREEMGRGGRALTAEHPAAEECADRLTGVLSAAARRPGAGRGERPPLSVVTTVRNERVNVRELLTALLPQLDVVGDEFVIVDGGSTDGTHELLTAQAAGEPRLRVLSRPGAGISAGRNVGIAEAANELVACTDAGCLPAPGWADALRLAASEPAALLTGTYRVAAGTVVQSAAAVTGYPDPDELRRPTGLVRLYGRVFGRVFDPTLPTGRSVAFRREAWQGAGGFPEHLQTGEDVTFGRAVVAGGGKAITVADAEVTWDQRPTFRATLRMYYRYGQGSARSGDPILLARDLTRAVAYPAAALTLWRGGPAARTVAVSAALAYLSLPLRRAAARPSPIRVALAVPLVTAARDLAKATGCSVAFTHGKHVRRPGGGGE